MVPCSEGVARKLLQSQISKYSQYLKNRYRLYICIAITTSIKNTKNEIVILIVNIY